jgi:hypothetical protein
MLSAVLKQRVSSIFLCLEDETFCFKTAESIAETNHLGASFSSFEYTLSLSL